MRPGDYLRILRRRWWVLLIASIVGLGLAFGTKPSTADTVKASEPRTQFRATHTLISDPLGDAKNQRNVDYDRMALLTTRGQVPQRVLEKLKTARWPTVIHQGSGGDSSSAKKKTGGAAKSETGNQGVTDPVTGTITRKAVRQSNGSLALGPGGQTVVAATPDPATGSLAITAMAPKRDFAVKVANTFAAELVGYLDDLGVQNFRSSLQTLGNERTSTDTRLKGLDSTLAVARATNSPDVQTIDSQRTSAVRQLDDIDQQLESLTRQGPQKANLHTLEPAAPSQTTMIVSAGGATASEGQRLAFGAALGFLLGLGLLILIEVLSARVRDVPGTEGAARMPVIAEIPVIRVAPGEKFHVAAVQEPSSLIAEAYRSLRTSLLAMWQRHPKNLAATNGHASGHANGKGNGNGNGNGSGNGRPLRTLLITSPGPAEGKSISVVNLATSFAETGARVIVLDADFRRPQLHRYFSRPATPSLGDLDLHLTPGDLEAVLQDTSIPGVRFAAAAPTKSDPGLAIAVSKAAARAASELADIVLLDSPPLLLANDAADLAVDVDATVLLARAGWTRRHGVVAAADLLRRLEATVVGVVLVGAEHGARNGYYGYYGYYGYGYGAAQPEENQLLKRLVPWRQGKGGSAGKIPRPRHSKAPISVSEPTPAPPRPEVDDDDPWL